MNIATVSPAQFEVRHTVCDDVEFLAFDIPNGWDDVAPICKKLLEFEGRLFAFSCWNSDRNTCHFRRALDGSFPKVATFKRR